MVTRVEKIAERFPHFYLHWERTSLIHSLIHAMSTRFDEMEKDLLTIMRSHWVDSAHDGDLDRLGSTFNMTRREFLVNGTSTKETDQEYHNRLKMAITSYMGGGTLPAIRMMVRITLGLPIDYPVEIIENPPKIRKWSNEVKAGNEWQMKSYTIQESVPDITLTVVSPKVIISNPTIMNTTTEEAITFRGTMKTGDILMIKGGQAFLNNKDLSKNLSSPQVPKLPRQRSKWKYTEDIGANIGVFDYTKFDTSVFAVDILSSITMEWVAHQPASFDVLIPRGILQKAGITEFYLQELIDLIKAVGVIGTVKVTEGGEK
jgi:hypothetical protein